MRGRTRRTLADTAKKCYSTTVTKPSITQTQVLPAKFGTVRTTKQVGYANSTVRHGMTRRYSTASPITLQAKFNQFTSYWLSEAATKKTWSFEWFLEKLIICIIFGITGTSSMYCVRPLLNPFWKAEPNEPPPSMINGPWSYRFTSLIVITPVYSCILLTVGAIFGQYHYFSKVAKRIWARPLRLVQALLKLKK
eukprot:TRINITY_DN2820_c0_g1_i3.p1 TRINITY_DN2820_c0_g1~~TRINITY_DN2820_c0_g1_i3.p1  ORF type:complete len:194 (-),score=3.97 TRINITY_DN2820_c0_g1_i3:92-673(-)